MPAAETLGSVTIICSDKTGTITEEQLNATKLYCDNKFYTRDNSLIYLKNKKVSPIEDKSLFRLIKTSVLCNNARFEKSEILDGKITGKYEIIGDPTESALVRSALDLGFDKKALTELEPRIKEISFSSSRKMMSILRKTDRRKVLYAKGASAYILKNCEFELKNGKMEKLSLSRKKQLIKISEKMEADALRVLAFAFRYVTSEKDLEQGLIFLGFIGMQDTPRKEVKQALEECINAGIKVKIITGDSALTAMAIAKQVGIKGIMMTGQELDKLNDIQLKKEINKIVIFARTTPEQKLRIINILMQMGEEVAVTGDVVNDVLALKKANIGVAMGERGTDIAKDASDIVLIDDNFASIVSAIKEGRIVYSNIKKITKYLLAVNFSEVLLVLYTIIFRLPLPFLPIQILWMNLVTDSIPAISLVNERDENLMNKKPQREKSILDNIKLFIIIAGLITFISELLVFTITMNIGYAIEHVRTMVVTGDIMFELFFLFTCRSDKKLLDIGIFSNKYLIYAVGASFVLQLLAIYSPLNHYTGFVPLSLVEWLFILPFALLGLVVFEAWKYVKKK